MATHYIYHITHVRNLSSIVASGQLLSDYDVRQQGVAVNNIGYSHIKERRLRRPIHAGMQGFLGQYVPFNFCSRSVMLYVISRGHADFNDGEDEIVHLVSTVDDVIRANRPFVFTDIHADLDYASHFDDAAQLDTAVDWRAMNQRQWGGDADCKRKRQAEFLVWNWFPWTCVRAVVAKSDRVRDVVAQVLQNAPHQPSLAVRRDWYYG